MPTTVRVARAALVTAAILAVVLLAVAVASAPSAVQAGRVALLPLLLGLTGALLAWRLDRGRRGARIGVVVVQALWVLLSLGLIGQGDPLGFLGLPLAVTVLTLVNTPDARRYLAAPAR